MKKSIIKKYIPWVLLAALAVLLAVLPGIARSRAEAGAEASVLSAQAEIGEIASTLAGGGTLKAEDAVEVTVPDGVEIKKFLVANGDAVHEGDALASIDKSSVMNAVVQVQETIDKLTEDLKTASEEQSYTTLTAQTSGRVKAVYVQTGDDVREAMLTHGALAVISLDGMMAVKFQSAFPVTAGQSVEVTTSDEKVCAGRVESVLEGGTVVTLSDDGPAPGDLVEISNADGALLGSGTLYIHSPWNVLATSGTVSSVSIREESRVYNGSMLISVNNMENSADYEKSLALRREYEDLMKELFVMYQNGAVTAPCDGYVAEIDKDIVTDVASSGEYHIRLLANAPDGGMDGAFNRVGMVTAIGDDGTLTVKMQLADAPVEDYSAPEVSTEASTMTLEGKCIPTAVYAWTGESWEETAVQVGDVFIFAYDADGNLLWMVYAGHNDIPTIPGFDAGGNSNMDPSALIGDLSGLLSGMGGGGFSGGFYGSYGTETQESEEELFSLEGITICTVTPGDKMTIDITVDELDILQYALGMEAEITVDALPGKAYTGVVTHLGGIGSNAGGSSKFTVELTLDRDENMLEGMNTSVVVHKDRSETLRIPTAALHDSGSKSFVYTNYDAKTEQLLAPVEVRTGISDSQYTEILSGLEENQMIWYTYYDQVVVKNAA